MVCELMEKIEIFREKFSDFVGALSEDMVREQLVLSYVQMECCRAALCGDAVEPVEMLDNGESSDLELFYTCKKVSEELSYLNRMVSVLPESEVADE